MRFSLDMLHFLPMSPDFGIMEWTGVHQKFDRIQNGIYRANATLVILSLFFVAIYFVLPMVDGSIFQDVNWLAVLPYLLGLGILIWAVGFLLGLSGFMPSYQGRQNFFYGTSPGPYDPGLLTGVTRDSNLTPRLNDLNPFSNFASRNTWASDFSLGKLSVSSKGIDGIIKFSWKDASSITSTSDAQVVCIHKKDTFLGVPLGSHVIELHFTSSNDAESFLLATRVYLKTKLGV